jgi:hypothetical protein
MILTLIAFSLFNTLDSLATPCPVQANCYFRIHPQLDVRFCDIKFLNSKFLGQLPGKFGLTKGKCALWRKLTFAEDGNSG